ncbi:MAG: hypothetical protein VX681_01800 [Myxococcota bacterium]|nr:hypothetical protein [Myxococcota bacterium]
MTEPDTSRSWLATCAALVLLAAAVRGASFWLAPPLELVGDELYYAQVARNLVHGEGHVFHEAGGPSLRAWRPPGQALTLAAVLDRETASGLDTSVHGAGRLVALQIALGSLLAAAAAVLGGLLFDRRVGTLAGLLVATYPTLIAFSHYLWSETLTALLLTAGLAAAVQYRLAPSPARAVATGLLLGAATLVREIALGVALACAWWWWREAPPQQRRRSLAHAGLMAAVATVCVAPWTLHNVRALDRFVPLSTIGWFATAEGNTFEAADWLRSTGPAHLAFTQRYFGLGDELARSDLARRHALAAIVAEQPLWTAKKAIRNGALLLSPDSYLLFKQSVGAYGEISPTVRGLSVAAVTLGWAVVALLGALGLAVARASERRLAIAVLAVPLLVHLISNATSRFRIPWLGLWLVFAALGARELPRARERWEHLPLGARAALVGFLAFVFGVAFPYFAEYGGRR